MAAIVAVCAGAGTGPVLVFFSELFQPEASDVCFRIQEHVVQGCVLCLSFSCQCFIMKYTKHKDPHLLPLAYYHFHGLPLVHS